VTPELVQKLAAGGWGMFENLAQSTSEDFARQREELAAQAAVLAAPFKTPEGKRCLELLVEKTILRPLVPPVEGTTLEQQALYANRREGQNGVVAIILNALSVVSQGKTQMPDRGIGP
jgi:hypothetical protein